ncbi:MAG: hypothetical protein ABJE66_01645 [Deltaproteobacteria bacterium]
MKLVLVALALSTLGACSDPVVKYFDVAAVELPQTTADATAFGVDLDGDGTSDNQLGVIFSALVSTHDATTHAADMIAAGAITSTLETIDGAPSYQGDTSGLANIALPIFADADPLVLPLEHVVISVDGDTALIRGGIPIEAARTAAYAGVAQMMHDNPAGHLPFARVLDTDHDGTISMDELENSSLLAAFLVADLHDSQQLSVGFRVTLSEHSVLGMPMDPCHDRVGDGDETGIDCGGSCMACPPAVPTCSDGVRDQFESGVDCGAACPPCASGQPCAVSADCASGTCNGAGPAGVGSCAP